MKKMALIALTVATCGCSTQTYYVNKGAAPKEPTQETQQPFFVNGIGQTREIDAAEVCGGVDKIIKVESHESFLNILLRGVTFGIYAPRQAKVYCAT